MNIIPQRPVWLDDEPAIVRWLHEALLRLERQPAEERTAPIRFTVSPRTFPALFHEGPEADHTWELIKSLERLLPLRIVPHKHRAPFAAEYEGARLELDASCEEPLRVWLGRPRITAEEAAWQKAVESSRHRWTEPAYRQLLATPLRMEGRSAEEMVAALGRIGEFLDCCLSLRELSARVFFGDSKFIENRCAALVGALYPPLMSAARALIVSVALPTNIKGVLFIENQDTYLRAVQGRLSGAEGLALVYSAGFLGSAARIRKRDGAFLHYHRENGFSASFEAWWYDKTHCEWPVAFFGDLDFEGMRILKGLRGVFGASAWEPGYAGLLCRLANNEGYAACAADKNKQRPVETTGCFYADSILLPALREYGSFVDQEAFWD